MVVLRNRRPPRMHPGCADPLLKVYADTREHRGAVFKYHIFIFPARRERARALKIRQINSAILKVPDGAWIR